MGKISILNLFQNITNIILLNKKIKFFLFFHLNFNKKLKAFISKTIRFFTFLILMN